MKKAIRILFCVLAAALLASSCTKGDINSVMVSGKWQLVHILTYDANNYANLLENDRPGAKGFSVYYKFISDGTLEVTEVLNTTNQVIGLNRGSWTVDQDTLIIKLSGLSIQYHVDTANITDLILFRDYELAGKKFHEVTTFKKF